MRIGPNTYAEIDYVLQDEDGDVLDDSSAEGGEPIRYVHGYGMLVPGLEKRLAGLGAGDACEIVIPPEEAYGLRDEELVCSAPREEAPDAEEGDEVVIEDDDGEEPGRKRQIVMNVVEVRPSELILDGNHPLAGLTLRYQVRVKSVRPATSEEIVQAAAAFDEERDAAEPPEQLLPLFSLSRSRKPDLPS